MPLPKSLPEIKKELQELLGNDLSATIRSLQELLPASAEKRSQTILLEGRLSQIHSDFHVKNIIKLDDYQLETARIRKALLDLVNGLDTQDFEPAPAGQAPLSAMPKFVVVYDEADEAHCKMLNKHLNVLKIMKKIRVYNVNEALAGEDFIARARQEIAGADYLIALITVNLFNSADWFGLLYESMGEGRRIIPLRIEKADFEGTGLEKLRSLPSQNRAVSEFKNADEAYLDIVTELKKLLPK